MTNVIEKKRRERSRVEEIKDEQRLDQYIKKYEMEKIFSANMRPFMKLLLFKRTECLFKQGEDVPYLLFFIEGKAKVYITHSNGRSLLLCFYEGFKVLGDIEIINFTEASSNVESIQDTYCIGISKENVKKYLLTDTIFLKFICSSLAKKLDRASKNSSINLLYPLENRLASYILAIYKEKTIDNEIELPDTLTEIAELLGTSYRHLLRSIKALEKKGILQRNVEGVKVLDQRALMHLSSDLYRE